MNILLAATASLLLAAAEGMEAMMELLAVAAGIKVLAAVSITSQ